MACILLHNTFPSATVFSFYIFTFLIFRKLNKPQLTNIKQQNFIGIRAFDSRLYLDISRSFKWKESFIFRYFKVCQVSQMFTCGLTDTCFIQKIYAPSSSLLQGKCLPFSPSPFGLSIFRLFVILSLTRLYRYTPGIFLFSTATFKYTYRAPLRRIEQEYSANVAWSTFQSLKRIQPVPVRFKLI